MPYIKNILLALVLSTTYLTGESLPDASQITESLCEAKPKEEQATSIDFADIYVKKAKETNTPEERVKLWLETYQTWGRTLKRTSDWNERELLGEQLKEIGRYFPGRSTS